MQLIIYDTHIIEGLLVCGSCKKEYQIVKGIPNMVLDDGDI